jgi:hypothetical protein
MGMPLIRRALGLGLILAAVHVARPSSVAAQTAGQHWQLVLANYTLSALAQFTGKVIRGDNVGRAARRAAVEALAPAALQHAGMSLLGRNWRLALPAQALVQKGAMLQRRSMLGLPQFAGFWTSWEIDYLWFNVRVAAGRFLVPRLNVETVRQAFVMRDPAPARLSWGRSLATGVPTWFTDQILEEAWGRERGQQVHLNRLVLDQAWTSDHGEGLYRHELEHTLQAIRSTPLVDVLLHQDASQARPVGFLRYNSDVIVYHLTGVQSFLGNGNRLLEHDRRYVEWEADSYAGLTDRGFTWH